MQEDEKFKIQKKIVSPFWARSLGTFGFAPRDLEYRSVLLDLRFVCVYPPPSTLLGDSDTLKWFSGAYDVPLPPSLSTNF